MNKVFLNKDDVIELVYEGKQTFQSVVEISAHMMVLADELRARKNKIRVLVNINKITNVTADSLLAAADVLDSMSNSKMAVFGGRAFLHKLANLVIVATRKQKTVRLFKSRSQAEKWLR